MELTFSLHNSFQILMDAVKTFYAWDSTHSHIEYLVLYLYFAFVTVLLVIWGKQRNVWSTYEQFLPQLQPGKYLFYLLIRYNKIIDV